MEGADFYEKSDIFNFIRFVLDKDSTFITYTKLVKLFPTKCFEISKVSVKRVRGLRIEPLA